jgi:hypothetical protein
MKRLVILFVFGLQMAAFGVTHQERAVAAVLMGEAWSEGIQGMTAVAEVIHQRAVEKKSNSAPSPVSATRKSSCLFLPERDNGRSACPEIQP